MATKPSSVLDREARIIIRRWTRCQYYVYLRPLDLRFLNPSADFAVHWLVTVEYRGMDFKQHRGQGMNLSEVIKKLNLEVPLKKPKSVPNAEIPKPKTKQKIRVTEKPAPKRKKPLPEKPRKKKRAHIR